MAGNSDDLVKSHQNDGFIVGARCFAPDIGPAQRAPTMQGAQKLRSEAYLQIRCNDEVAAQRRRWTFYEAINFRHFKIPSTFRSSIPQEHPRRKNGRIVKIELPRRRPFQNSFPELRNSSLREDEPDHDPEQNR